MQDAAVPEPDFTIPSAKAVTDAIEDMDVPERENVEQPENLAGNGEVCKKFHDLATRHYRRFLDSAERKDLDTKLKDADAKFRLAPPKANRYRDGSNQKTDSLSNVASSQFYKSVTLLSSADCSVIFSDDGTPPVEYKPVEGSDEYPSTEQAQAIADSRNAYFAWWWNKEQAEDKLKEMVLFAEKNSIEIYTVQWDYCVDKRFERVPGYYTKDGNPVAFDPSKPPAVGEMYRKDGTPLDMVVSEDGRIQQFVFAEKTRVVRDCPVVERVDVSRIYWDLNLPMQQQTCIVIRSQKTHGELMEKQASGEYQNVETLTTAQLYNDPQPDGQRVQQDRYSNADNDFTSGEMNGTYDTYHIYMLAPISENKWKSDGVPVMHEAVFAGPLGSFNGDINEKGEKVTGGAVCLQLRKFPYNHGRIPYHIVYTHPDDKTGPHMGNIELLTCNVEEQDATMNQHIDCKTMRVFKPWMAEKGNVLERSLKFRRGNHIVWVQRGPVDQVLKQAEVEDITQSTVPTLDMLKRDAEEITRTVDVVQGSFAGSRTTGTEYMGAKDQAMKPLIEHAKYLASQILIPIARDVADLTNQYADPDNPLVYNGMKINPAEHYGDYEVQIVSIEKYQADLVARQTLVNFLQAGGFDKSAAIMGDEGQVEFWRTYGKYMRFPNWKKIWGATRKNIEAENQALSDWNRILADPIGAVNDPNQLPKEGEAHKVHISVLQPLRDRFAIAAKTMPPEQQEYAGQVIAAADLYIMLHEQMDATEQAQQQAVTNMAGPQQQSQMPGEAGGDVLSGVAGQAQPM